MAASSDPIAALVTCSICMDDFKDPRTLPCVHTFCFQCLQGVCKDKCPRDDVPCPLCRKKFQIPADGLDSLQHNFIAQSAVDAKAQDTQGWTASADAAGKDANPNIASDLRKLKAAFETGGVKKCAEMLENIREEWKSVPLNVAVIGTSGVGKSSFINAIRHLKAGNESAAKIGVKETTVETRKYAHPNNPNLLFWDLPGVGTDRFPRETYLSNIEVDRFDFFLLITATRFMQDDTWLATEFRKRNKHYFFIRTKVEADILNTMQAYDADDEEKPSETSLIADIRQSTEKHLKEKCDNAPLFLIDSYQRGKFEFGRLENQLVENFPKLKRSALVLSWHASSEQIVKLKAAELRSRIWMAATLSGVMVAVYGSVAGAISYVFDVRIVQRQSVFYFEQLGLDKISLERCSTLTGSEHEMLSSLGLPRENFSSSSYIYTGDESLVMLMKNHISRERKQSPVKTVLRCIPIIGGIIGSPMSFYGTSSALEMVLNQMENVALKVIASAAENAVSGSV